MKKKLLSLSLLCAFVLTVVLLKHYNTNTTDAKISKLKEQHAKHLANSPYKNTKFLGRKERKHLGLPPNAFFEQEWERTLDPNLGYPNYENALKIQHELIKNNNNLDANSVFGVPGESPNNAWVERGPSNVGGRTRAILYDPNDSNGTRVFAGGVSGGLWVNQNIENENTTWQLVSGVPENIAVTKIVSDPNNPAILYIASGESYTQGNVIGNGIYRSTNAGVTWEMIFGGPDGTSTLSTDGEQIRIGGIFYVNDIITRTVNGSTEVYFAAAVGVNVAAPGDNADPLAFLGLESRGVYRSIDNGDSWTQLNIDSPSNSSPFPGINPNDLEIDADNNIWLATTSSFGLSNGGEIYTSSDGINFTFINNIPNAARTEIATSPENSNLFYIAADVNGEADLFITSDAFANISSLEEPNDVDTTVDANDYAREQAFYNLPIEVDPNNENILYIGGINSFRGNVDQDSRTVDWEQISRQNESFASSLDISVMHADIHAIVFNPNNSNQAVFGTDGGIFYGRDLENSSSQGNRNIEARNRGYNVTQFYTGAINDATGNIAAAAQDNGNLFNFTPTTGNNRFFDITSGDGAFAQFDDQGQYFIASTQFINYTYFELPIVRTGAARTSPPSFFNQISSANYSITDQGNSNRDGGNFINEAVIDTNLDILYINATNTSDGTQVARYSNFQNGRENIIEQTLTNALLVGTISAMQVSPFNSTATRLLVGTEQSRIINIDDADTNPSFRLIQTTEFVGSISDIEFGANEDIIMATISNYGVESIFYSENGGVNWSPKQGDLPDIPVFTILQNPFDPNEVIVGTQFGVWRTNNFLATNPNWVQSFNGMSNVPVRDLDLRASRNEVLATTHGRGVFTGRFTGGTFTDPNNIRVEVTSETCPGLNNGNVTVTANAIDFDYTANLSGNGINTTISFNSTAVFEDVPAGRYTVCVSVDGQVFQTCFELDVNSASPLNIDFNGVLSSANPNTQLFTFSIEEGTGPFEVRFNDELIQITNENVLALELVGSGLLEVTSSRLCEGSFTFDVNSIETTVFAFPNPVTSQLTIHIPNNSDTSSGKLIPVRVYNIIGQLVYSNRLSMSNNKITLPFDAMAQGLYFVNVDMNNTEEILKIIKQ